MDHLEYIREIGCEMEGALDSAAYQMMTDKTVQNNRHCMLQRNFVASKINEFQFFAKKLTSLLENNDELAEIRSMKATKSHEEALADLLQCVENLEASEGKKNMAFAREHRGKEPSDAAVQRRFFYRIRQPTDIPSEKTPISHGHFTQDESFGRYVDFRTVFTEYCGIVQALKEHISLSNEELAKMEIPSYVHFIAQAELHLSNFPRRVKYGAFAGGDTAQPEDAAYLESDFVPRYAAYIHRLGDLCKTSHLRVFPLDVDIIQEEKETFPTAIVETKAENRDYLDVDKNLLTADFITAAEKRVGFWMNFLKDRIQATARMFERRQIITPEEVDAEEAREELDFRLSLSNVQLPPWAYVLPEKVPARPNAPVPQKESDESAETSAQPESAIPLWLRKINGLNVRLFCQICNQTYAGPTIFEQHFREFRHTQSLSRLGIINIPAMHGVDAIDEAKKLWTKIIDARKRKRAFWTPEDMEFEDELGDVRTNREAVTL